MFGVIRMPLDAFVGRLSERGTQETPTKKVLTNRVSGPGRPDDDDRLSTHPTRKHVALPVELGGQHLEGRASKAAPRIGDAEKTLTSSTWEEEDQLLLRRYTHLALVVVVVVGDAILLSRFLLRLLELTSEVLVDGVLEDRQRVGPSAAYDVDEPRPVVRRLLTAVVGISSALEHQRPGAEPAPLNGM